MIRLFILFFIYTLCVPQVYAEYFEIRDFEVKVDISKEGYIYVEETIEVFFFQPRRGIFRKIPYKYSINGEILELDIKNIRVTSHSSKTSYEGNSLVVKIGDPNIYVEGRQVYNISYRVKKPFLYHDDFTEFYWNVIGDQWPVPIIHASYEINLPEAIPMDSTQFRYFSGASGSQMKKASLVYYMGKISGETNTTLMPYEGLTVAIKLPVEMVARPSAIDIWLKKYGGMTFGSLLFLLISSIFYRTWQKYGKDYPLVQMVSYAPPKDITPSEAGVIIDEKADNVDIICLLPYWAMNGYITISQIPQKWAKDDYKLTKIKDLPKEVPPYEDIIFSGLFGHRNEVMVSDLKEKFYTHMSDAKTSLKSHIHSMGIYYPISIKMQVITFIGAFVCSIGALGMFFLFQSLALAIGIGLASILGYIFAYYMLKKNEKGVHLYQEILGFKTFVKSAEKDKLERMLKDDPMYFEKTLPYAMIFGYAKQWSKKFEGLDLQAPSWYISPYGVHHGSFGVGEFGDSFNESIKDIQSSFNSMPSSSGGGGFSGGGSVGGGFGGGGGGSW